MYPPVYQTAILKWIKTQCPFNILVVAKNPENGSHVLSRMNIFLICQTPTGQWLFCLLCLCEVLGQYSNVYFKSALDPSESSHWPSDSLLLKMSGASYSYIFVFLCLIINHYVCHTPLRREKMLIVWPCNTKCYLGYKVYSRGFSIHLSKFLGNHDITVMVHRRVSPLLFPSQLQHMPHNQKTDVACHLVRSLQQIRRAANPKL